MTTDIAILPIGSYEWHGGHMPAHSDTLIAAVLARAIADAKIYSSVVLPTLGFSCSHEHREGLSIRPETLLSFTREIIDASLMQYADVVVLVNAHNGNHALYNLAQELNRGTPRVLLFPRKDNWIKAAAAAGVETSVHEDVHAGEIELSVLMHSHPELVDITKAINETRAERPMSHFLGVDGYSKTGVLGQPTLASAVKGAALVKSLVEQALGELQMLFDRRETARTIQVFGGMRR
jgi:creatinine amidohydrolase